MEHEVYVPFSADQVKAALTDRELVARCVPGLQRDAGSEGQEPEDGRIEGRLRVRIAGSTITYRGALTVTPEGEGFTVRGFGTEARGSGSAELELTLTPRPGEDGEGTRLVLLGTARGEGRLAAVEQKAAGAAGRRLLNRFAAALTEDLRETAGPAESSGPATGATDGTGDTDGTGVTDDTDGAGGIGEPDDNEPVIPGIPGPESGAADTHGNGRDREPTESPGPPGTTGPAATGEPGESPGDTAPEPLSADDAPEPEAGGDTTGAVGEETGDPYASALFGTEIPPSPGPLDEGADEEQDRITAEAAHARRTMIGRSAEEVDHAPPRGRYAPVPAPEPGDAAAVLRWAAPAAALAVVGAVVLSRVLRRRR